MITIHPASERALLNESNFEIFKHKDLICCILRMSFSGNLNGYVAVPKEHPFYGKSYSDKIEVLEDVKFNGNYIGLLISAFDEERKENVYSIDMALNVHGGVTFSNNCLAGIDPDLFGDIWWFGFDTMHAGDLKPYQNEIDRIYQLNDEQYRDFKYVKDQVKSLAEQLILYK